MCLLAGSFVYSVGTHCFVVPANIAPGGASGLALMVEFWRRGCQWALTMVVNIPPADPGLDLSEPEIRWSARP